MRLTDSHRYGVALALVAVSYVLSSWSTDATFRLAVVVVQLAVVWLVLTIAGSARVRRAAGVAVLAIGFAVVVGAVIEGTSNDPDLTGALFALNAVLYVVAPVAIVISLVARDTVDAQSLLGAVCAYVLIGMAFAFVYRVVGELQSEPFFGSTGSDTLSNTLFFSFTTLTTTGYGNLIPAGQPGQSLAVLEALTGQLFLVVAVAKIVASMVPRRGPAARATAEDEA